MIYHHSCYLFLLWSILPGHLFIPREVFHFFFSFVVVVVVIYAVILYEINSQLCSITISNLQASLSIIVGHNTLTDYIQYIPIFSRGKSSLVSTRMAGNVRIDFSPLYRTIFY